VAGLNAHSKGISLGFFQPTTRDVKEQRWKMRKTVELMAGAKLLFEVISRAYEHHSLMLTTNLAFEEWTEIFGSERLAGALLDQLTHRCHILEANRESHRLRQSRKRSNWKPSSRQNPNPKEKDK
jgi:hypothetical protein